jgi:hypothetical protein
LITYGASWDLKQYGGGGVARLEGWEDPYLVALRLSGGSAVAAEFYEPFVHSAMMLANMGVLGGGTDGGDLYAGPSSSEERMALVEQFYVDFDQGAFVDPHLLFQDIFDRALNTPIEKFASGEDTMPGESGTQVDVTNGAIMAIAPFLTTESAEGIKSTLERMGGNYMVDVATGAVGPDISYPEYLEQHGARNWFGPDLTPTEIAGAFSWIPEDEPLQFPAVQIVGRGLTGGQMHAFMLTPTR